MTNMKLTQLWQYYQSDNLFNYASVRPFLEEYGEMVQFSKGRQLIEQGGYPEFVYFIVKGLVVGKKSTETVMNLHIFWQTIRRATSDC